MFMDYRPQQQGEHDFLYAARVLRAAGTEFEAMLRNGSYTLDDLRRMKERLETLIRDQIDGQLTRYTKKEVIRG